MSAYIALPFVVFGFCVVAQFWFVKRVKDRLIEQHPDIYLEVERSSFLPDAGLLRFVRASEYKRLGDEELNRRARGLKLIFLIMIVAWIAFGIALFTIPLE